MDIILLERIKNLGDLGDTVKVRAGFARNYLVPQGKGLTATEENRKVFEVRKAELIKKAQDSLNASKMRATQINGKAVSISARAAEEGKLYGSIGPNDIVRAAAAAGIELSKSEVSMPEGPIRATGEFELEIVIDTDVTAKITVTVVEEAAA